MNAGAAAECTILGRNYRNREQTHRIAIHTPPGLSVEPALLEGKRASDGVMQHTVKLRANPSATKGLHLVALDITRDDMRHGELFDMVAWVGASPAA